MHHNKQNQHIYEKQVEEILETPEVHVKQW
jgi:hypothetical protein